MDQHGLKMRYELPDGNVIALNSERFRCPEVLFEPSLMGKEASGIHEITFESIMRRSVALKGCFLLLFLSISKDLSRFISVLRRFQALFVSCFMVPAPFLDGPSCRNPGATWTSARSSTRTWC